MWSRLNRSRLATALTTLMLAICLTSAVADGPGGLGKLLPPVQGVTQSDGSVLYANGVVLEADKRVSWHDANNTVWTPVPQGDGSWLYPQDGTRLYPDGTVTYTDY